MKDNKRGIGLIFALQGLKTVFSRERNFKIHLIALLIVIIVGFVLKLTYIEWAIIIIISSIVLCTEIINSVIELIIDYLKPEIHPIAKQIKDMSAGAVLIASISAATIGLVVFIRRLILLL